MILLQSLEFAKKKHFQDFLLLELLCKKVEKHSFISENFEERAHVNHLFMEKYSFSKYSLR